jgi:hypothetical protein
MDRMDRCVVMVECPKCERSGGKRWMVIPILTPQERCGHILRRCDPFAITGTTICTRHTQILRKMYRQMVFLVLSIRTTIDGHPRFPVCGKDTDTVTALPWCPLGDRSVRIDPDGSMIGTRTHGSAATTVINDRWFVSSIGAFCCWNPTLRSVAEIGIGDDADIPVSPRMVY